MCPFTHKAQTRLTVPYGRWNLLLKFVRPIPAAWFCALTGAAGHWTKDAAPNVLRHQRGPSHTLWRRAGCDDCVSRKLSFGFATMEKLFGSAICMFQRSFRGRPLKAPAAFIHPCQPTVVAQPPSGPGWAHELKHDGYRCRSTSGMDGSARYWARTVVHAIYVSGLK
jgi:hypothetical protein